MGGLRGLDHLWRLELDVVVTGGRLWETTDGSYRHVERATVISTVLRCRT